MNASLTPYLCDFVAAQVASGRFGDASEVMRAGLRPLERDLRGAPRTRFETPEGSGPTPPKNDDFAAQHRKTP